MIVPRPSPSVIVAFTGFVRFTKKVSSPSKKLSPKTGTASVFTDWTRRARRSASRSWAW